MKTDQILVVEDEKDLREVYSLILRHHGYGVHVSSNGLEALEAVKAHHPKLILLDIFMPLMDGKEFLQKLDMKEHSGVRVVVCSNTSDSRLMDEMLKLGAEKVVTKANLDPSGLVDLVAPYFP
jgi:CheY-like chemotaxis protein